MLINVNYCWLMVIHANSCEPMLVNVIYPVKLYNSSIPSVRRMAHLLHGHQGSDRLLPTSRSLPLGELRLICGKKTADFEASFRICHIEKWYTVYDYRIEV